MKRLARSSITLGLLVVVLVLVGCGSHGSAQPLGNPAHVTLAWLGGQPAGTATVTPVYATHVVTYLGADPIPYNGAKTPVQLRKGDCNGPVLAALTDNAPVPSGTQPPLVRQDAVGGVDVATAPSAELWVTLLSTSETNATILACGHPLSEKRQFFDLLNVTPSANGLLLGHPLGTALTEPIIASRLDVDLAQPTAGPLAWAVRSGGCTGGSVAGGQFPSGATHGAIVFHVPDTSAWWLSVTSGEGANAKTACGKVSA
jgi:hypothetical protein